MSERTFYWMAGLLVMASAYGCGSPQPLQQGSPVPEPDSSSSSTEPDRLQPDYSVPTPEIPVSEQLGDPAMDDVARIVQEGVAPSDLDRFAAQGTRNVDDVDRDIAGFNFSAERKGVEIVTREVTYFVVPGIRRESDGTQLAAGVYIRRSGAGTIQVLDESIVPLDRCGLQPATLVRSGNPDPTSLIIRCGSAVQYSIDVTTTPVTVSG
jgi:hypothetical protein